VPEVLLNFKMYEVAKYAIGCSAALFGRLDTEAAAIGNRDLEALLPVIEECCRIKARIVSEDEREAGLRRVLNFGHTAGHAFESVTGYRRFRHGEAVAWGIRVAAGLSRRRGRLNVSDVTACERLIARIGPLPRVDDLRASDLLAAIARDKKMVQGTLNFVLPTGVGQVAIVQDVAVGELHAALVGVGCRDE
jgi:3-dehydroquinate synthase